MARQRFLGGAIAAALFLVLAAGAGLAQGPAGGGTEALLGTAFSYQGKLLDGGTPANGTYDFQFSLYDDGAGGTQLGSTIAVDDVGVVDGLFTVLLDYGGNIFTGEARWLEIAVKRNADSSYTTLDTRVALTPSPHALALPGLWTQQNGTSPNLIGGYWGNSVTGGVVGATIGGGGDSVGTNRITDSYGTVAGGHNNQAGDGAGLTTDRTYAAVGGGGSNTASGKWSTIGGGYMNEASADRSTIGGGFLNDAFGAYSTVGGGYFNQAKDQYDATGGGYYNTADGPFGTVGGGNYDYATGAYSGVLGGDHNTASGQYSAVGGGTYNTASGWAATIPGGRSNLAQGDYSFAAGRRAKTDDYGSFVWADFNDYDFSSTTNNQFNVRATGGVRLVVGLDWSGTPDWTCSVVDGGTWSCSSDRNLKENMVEIDGRVVLDALQRVPIYAWNGRGQDPTIRHMGPTAQDFYAAFEVGEDDKHLATIDLDGVALAAIQGLNQVVEEQDAAIAALSARVAELEGEAAPGPAAAVASGGLYLPAWGLLLGGLAVAAPGAAALVVVLRRGGGR